MDRTGEAAGVQRQDADCRELAGELSWEVVEIYVDNDVSATSGKPRPAYQRMMADIESGRVSAVICWHPDRLYRTVRDLERLVDLVETHHVAIRTVKAGDLDLGSPTGRMIARILGAVAQGEVEHKADRWNRSIRQRREAGQWWNSASRMFGYTRNGELVPDEMAALRHVGREILLKGGTVRDACFWLAEQGWRTTRGNDWMPSSLLATLRSPKLAGLSALRGVILGQGDWPPIFDRAEWERIVAAIETSKLPRTSPRRSLLTRIVYCGVQECARPLYRAARARGEKIYRCQNELKASGHVSIAVDPLEQMVETYAQRRLADPRVRRAIAARLSTAGTRAAELTAEIDDIEREIDEWRDAMDHAGTRSKAEIVRKLDELDERLAAKREALSHLSPIALPEGDRWPEELDRRVSLIKLVVDYVTVAPTATRGGRFDPGRVHIEPAKL